MLPTCVVLSRSSTLGFIGLGAMGEYARGWNGRNVITSGGDDDCHWQRKD